MSTSAKEYKAKQNKQSLKSAKYSSRVYNRCSNCGRSGAYFSHFGLCRICLRNFAFKGEVPGLTKASW